ncbi:MAG: heparinase II/III domain-containing protein [Planctomycetaceae bacterium]
MPLTSDEVARGAIDAKSVARAPLASTAGDVWLERAGTPGMAEHLARWVNLCRYHKPEQLIGRLVSRARMVWLRTTRGGRFSKPPQPVPSVREGNHLQSWLERKLADRVDSECATRAAEVTQARFRFLGEERLLSSPIDWRLTTWRDADPLWRFHLHYQEYLLDLLVEQEYDLIWAIVGQWIAANGLSDPRVFDDAWHPFCISRRLPVWFLAWHSRPPPESLQAAIRGSLAQQAEFLASHLERDLGGNHLLENARSLVLAGSFFRGPYADRWLRLGRQVLFDELPRQILPHGEHFERSPMYHAQMLDTLLDARDAACHVTPDLSAFCGKSACDMARFLKAILHPDGQIPLLADSVFDQTPPPVRLIHAAENAAASGGHAAEPENRQAARAIGPYWTWRQDNDYLLWDAGPVGADHLPAHAHSDLLTLEASIQGQRVIVDSGVFHYRDDGARRYCRSTGAHNVLQLDAREQCDTWSRFRMGYRGHPSLLETGRWRDFDWARCRHDAYRRVGVPWVARWVACRPGGPWLIVDWATAEGQHELSSWLHFHPAIELRLIGCDEAEFTVKSSRWRVRPLAPGDFELVEGSYCPRFGERIRAPVLRWHGRMCLPAACGWQLAQADCESQATLRWSNSGGLRLQWENAELDLE